MANSLSWSPTLISAVTCKATLITRRPLSTSSASPVFRFRLITQLADQATILICKLAYRVADPNMKGKLQLIDEDYEYFVATYTRY